MASQMSEKEILSEENLKLSKALRDLSDIEGKLEKIDDQVNQYRISITAPVFEERYNVISNIPNFWKTVLETHSEFSDFIPVSDFKYLELIKNIKVNTISNSDFSITFEFDQLQKANFPKQKITKIFKLSKDINDLKYTSKLTDEQLMDMQEFGFLTSEPVDIVWPSDYDSINPKKISSKTDPNFKQNYRAGMKTFFSWLNWTGLKHGKEFPNGDGLANLFMEDIYPHCLKHYIESKRDFEDEVGGSESEIDEDEEELEGFHVDVISKEEESEEPLKKKMKL
ncbi:hypothetical protein QEN19_002893 [Hanseniaspora menglaensis]